MAFYEHIFDFITDKSKRISARATIFIISILLLLLADNIVGFSYYYNKERQLEQLKTVTVLLKDNTLDIRTRYKLKLLQQEFLSRKDFIDHIVSFGDNISIASQKSNDVTINESLKKRSFYWFLFSTSGIYILVTIILLPILLLFDRNTPFLQLLLMLIMFAIVMFFTSWFNYWLFDKIIPYEIFGSWVWNYIINFLLQMVLISGLYWTTKKLENVNK